MNLHLKPPFPCYQKSDFCNWFFVKEKGSIICIIPPWQSQYCWPGEEDHLLQQDLNVLVGAIARWNSPRRPCKHVLFNIDNMKDIWNFVFITWNIHYTTWYLAAGPSTLEWISCQGSLGPTDTSAPFTFEFLNTFSIITDFISCSSFLSSQSWSKVSHKIAGMIWIQGFVDVMFWGVPSSVGQVETPHIGHLHNTNPHSWGEP